MNEKALKKSFRLTVDRKVRRLLCESSLVLSEASIVSLMPRFNCINVQNRELLAVSRDHDPVIGSQIVDQLILEAFTELPPNTKRQVSLSNRTSRGDRIIEIYFVVTKVERDNDWQNLDKKMLNKLQTLVES